MEKGCRVSGLGVMMTLAPHQGDRNQGWLPLAHAWHQKAIFHTMLRISEPASKATDWYPFTWMLGLYCLLVLYIKRYFLYGPCTQKVSCGERADEAPLASSRTERTCGRRHSPLSLFCFIMGAISVRKSSCFGNTFC